MSEPPSDTVVNQSWDVREEYPKRPLQIPPQIIDAREPTTAPLEPPKQSMALSMAISSCEQSTIQNRGDGGWYTSC